MAFFFWDLGSVGGPKMYHMSLIINLNDVQSGCCGFLDPRSSGCEYVSLSVLFHMCVL